MNIEEKINAKIEQLNGELQELLQRREDMSNAMRQCEIRLTQITGALNELMTMIEPEREIDEGPDRDEDRGVSESVESSGEEEGSVSEPAEPSE